MSTAFRLLLPRALHEEMLAQARAELPNECCGLLAGRLLDTEPHDGPVEALVIRRYALVNEAASPVEYLSEPKSMFTAVRDMDRLGLTMLAVYHSHPTTDPVPSRKDCERNYSPDVMNLIISLKTPDALTRAWWLTVDEYREAQWESF